MKLRLKCREVTRIVLQGEDRDWTLGERIVLRLHWLACDGCTRFRDQQRLLRQSLRRWRAYRDEAGDGPSGGSP